jgi:hypothetical protein
MTASRHHSEGLARGARILRTALGPVIARFLEGACVFDVMLNSGAGASGLKGSRTASPTRGERLSGAHNEHIVRLVTHDFGAEVHAGAACAHYRSRSMCL